jgi:hypothetical protein
LLLPSYNDVRETVVLENICRVLSTQELLSRQFVSICGSFLVVDSYYGLQFVLLVYVVVPKRFTNLHSQSFPLELFSNFSCLSQKLVAKTNNKHFI